MACFVNSSPEVTFRIAFLHRIRFNESTSVKNVYRILTFRTAFTAATYLCNLIIIKKENSSESVLDFRDGNTKYKWKPADRRCLSSIQNNGTHISSEDNQLHITLRRPSIKDNYFLSFLRAIQYISAISRVRQCPCNGRYRWQMKC
jgi:hypothetical protein